MIGSTLATARNDVYKKLFTSMADGFALHEAIYDGNGTLADFRFIEVNSAFERITGFHPATLIGKTVRDVFPNTSDYLMNIFEQVLSTGTAQVFERYAHDLGTHLEISAFRPDAGLLACVVVDISTRKAVEEQLVEHVASAGGVA